MPRVGCTCRVQLMGTEVGCTCRVQLMSFVQGRKVACGTSDLRIGGESRLRHKRPTDMRGKSLAAQATYGRGGRSGTYPTLGIR